MKKRFLSKNLGGVIGESLEGRCFLSATIPGGYAKVAQLSVSSDGAGVGSSVVLDKGDSFYVVASGAVQIANGPRFADAQYYQKTIGAATWLANGPNLIVSGASSTGWGAYQSDHVYGQVLKSTGSHLEAYFKDTVYKDNSGSMTLTIYEKVKAKSITATIGSQSQTSTDTGLTITDGNVVAVPQSSGFMQISLNGVSPTSKSIDSQIQWTVVENTTDAQKGNVPTITVSSTNPLQAQLSTSGVGSFNVIAYVNSEAPGTFQAGDQIMVFHVADVHLAISNFDPKIGTSNNNFTGSANPQISVSSGDADNPANKLDAVVHEVGGGPTGSIGLSQITNGWLQNITGDTAVCNYPGGHQGYEALLGGTSYPLLDTSNPNFDQYGGNIFLSTSKDVAGAAATAGDNGVGQLRDVSAVDAPSVVYDTKYPGTDSVAQSTDGTESFADCLVAYSSSFNQWYVPSAAESWAVNFKYHFVGAHWENNGSSVAATPIAVPSLSTLSSFASSQKLKIKTAGPTIEQENDTEYR